MTTPTLGLTIDSSPAKRAAVDLDALVPAAGRAEAATNRLGTNANTAFQKVAAGASDMAAKINAALNVRSDFGTAGLLQHGRELDELRAKYNPLFAAQRAYRQELQEISVATRMGALSEKERAAAVLNTKVAFTQQVNSIHGIEEKFNALGNGANNVSGAYRKMSFEARNLSFQLIDVAQGVAMGQSPFMIMAQQAGQIGQILAFSPKGVGGLLKEIGGLFAPLMRAGVLAFGGIAAAIGTAIAATYSFSKAQREMALQISGAGTASGATLSDINNVSVSGFSMSESRNFAATLAATGKVTRDSLQPLVAIGKDISKVYGVDAADAAQLMAKAFANPAKGAEDLNQRLGFLDAATLRHIQNLQAQNRLYEAQAVLQKGVQSAMDGMRTQLESHSSLWTAIGNGISNAWTKLGEYIARGTGIGLVKGLDEQIADANKEVARLEANLARIRGNRASLSFFEGSTVTDLENARKNLAELTAQWNKHSQAIEEARQKAESFATTMAIDRVAPEIAARQQLVNTYENLRSKLDAVNMAGANGDVILKQLGITYQQLAELVARARANLDGFRSSAEQTGDSLRLQIDAIGKRSPGALGDLAYRQSILSAGQTPGKTDAATEANAELSRTLAIRNAQQQILDTQRQQSLAASQRVDSARLELSILGASTVEQERQRALLQAKQQAEQESLRTYGTRDAYDKAHLAALEKQIDAEARIKQAIAEQQALRDTKFDIAQIGRSDDEQQIAARLRSIYGDDYERYTNGAIAANMRYAQSLRFAKDTFGNFASDLRQGLANGETFWHSFRSAAANALDTISQKLMDMAVNNLWEAAFPGGKGGSGFLGAIFSGITSLFGGGAAPTMSLGGLAAIHHSGYGPGDPLKGRYVHPAYFENAPRFHSGIGPGERAAVIRDDESVLTPGQMRQLAPARNAQPIQVTVAPQYVFHNADPGVEARLRQEIQQSAERTKIETVQAVSKLHQNAPGSYLPRGA